MPGNALLDGEIVRPFDVEKPIHEQLRCVAKEHKMHLVEQHDREDGAFIPRHFRHNPNVDRESCPAGGGESNIHEHRKEVALSKALVEFDCSEWGLEKKIGDNIADAYVKFSDGHPRYGEGLAIEYQHENKGKDKKAATENYFQENYSTIWLWRDQFNSSDDDVDLLGGRVCPIWPECVPKQESWKPVQFRDIQSRWKEAYKMGLSTSGASAKLPPEWCDEKARMIWERQDWNSLFDEPEDFTPIWDYSTVEASIPKEWVLPSPEEYWRRTDWSDRFRDHHPYDKHIDSANDVFVTSEIPFINWIMAENGRSEYLDCLKSAYRKGKLSDHRGETATCPHCGIVESHDKRHTGETHRSSMCGNCGEWYTVYERKNNSTRAKS